MRRIAAILTALIAVTVVAAVLTSSSRGSGAPYEVRAIFDDAAFAVPGEDVRIAGAIVGSIKSLDVCTKAPCPVGSPLNKAAVTLQITAPDFTPFHADAHCAIRPQSLIGEKYVDCTPGSSSSPELTKITNGAGSGTYLLPLSRTSSPIDSDIVADISQAPIRQRFALIIDELGTGLAARGSDLNDVIHRANPALGKTDQVLKILADQNRVLARLATESDAVLAPLARVKGQLADFIRQANTTSVASAARASAISRSFQLFPTFLQQLRPLVADLGKFADQGTPLMASLAQSSASVSREFQNLAPFARAARPALIELGKASQEQQPALVSTIPLARRLDNLGTQAKPTAQTLDRLTASLDQTGAIEYLMSLLYYGVTTTNAFNNAGHFARSWPLVGQCASYSRKPILGCEATFGSVTGAASDRSAPDAAVSAVVRQVLTGNTVAQGTASGANGSHPTGGTASGTSQGTAAGTASTPSGQAPSVARTRSQPSNAQTPATAAEASHNGSLQGLLDYLIGAGR